MILTEAQHEAIAEYMNGTCNSETEATQYAVNAFKVEETQELEDEISKQLEENDLACCSQCGWWSELSDMEEIDGELHCDCDS